MIKPKKLKKGDRIATVSLSWGGAGDEDLLWRYETGKERLEEEFGLEVVEMENTLKGSAYIYKHPEKRAEDLMNAFLDPNIKGIFSCIGGEDSIRMLPYIDFNIIRENPKIFIGYSDSTITHLMCFKAGLTSFYGPSILAEFAENIDIYDYTKDFVRRELFSSEALGIVEQSEYWTSERIEWLEELKYEKKKMLKNTDYEFLQGEGSVRGKLFGGCLEVLDMAKETVLWEGVKELEDTILFFETSEEMPEPNIFRAWLRNLGIQGVLGKAKGIIFGKPQNEQYYGEYRESILKIVEEFKLENIPIVLNMSFGHNEPMGIIPYGVLAEIDCDKKEFKILESGVID